LQGKIERKVFLEDVKLLLKCGVYPEERKLGVEVLVSVEISSEEFVDYEKLYNEVFRVANTKEFIYLEDYQEELLDNILKNWNPNSVRIKISKLSLPFQNSLKRGGVELLWKRRK